MRDYTFKEIKRSRSGIGVIFCIFLLIASIATAIDVPKELDEKDSSKIENLSYTFLFQEPSLKITEVNTQGFSLIEMDGCIAIGKNAGYPMMPVKPVTLLIPPKKTVSNVEINGIPVNVDLAGIDLVEKPVFPYQNPVPFGQSPGDFEIDNSLYSTDAFYPTVLQDEYHIGYSRGYAIFDISLNPIKYNPVNGNLLYYSEMTINIELEETDANPLFRNNPEDQAWVEKLVYNPDATKYYTPDLAAFIYDGGLCDPSDDYDYVIITTTYNSLDYWDTTGTTPYNWESLMDKHEEDDGLSCTLVTVQDIDACSDYGNSNPLFDDQEAHIREFAKDAYQDWGTSYILIGGDDEWINARHMDTNYEGNIDSDIYWSNLDSTFNEDEDYDWGEEGDNGFDLYAEIFIGRVTCDTPQDVSNWLTKSFYYADSIDETYLDNAAFYGGNTGWNCQGDDFMDYSAIKGTDDWLGPNPGADGPFPTWAGFQFGFETWNAENPDNQYDISVQWTAEPPNPGWQGGSEPAAINGLKNDINNDQVTVLSGIAHANAQMSLDVGSSSWESDYHNTKPFFIHDYGCHCGDMDASDDGVLHSMLFHSDTELAFAAVYNTCYGWGNFDTTNSSSAFQAKEFWSYFLDMKNKSGDFTSWQLGKAHAFSKDRMAPTINWDYSTGTWRAIIQGCLLFGDPAQQLKTPHPSEPPANPDAPDGPDDWIPNVECTFSAVTTDPEGEQIFYMFDWGDGTFSDWLGPYSSGQTIDESHIWTELGNYEITVKARDIWGVSSDWSEPALLSIIPNEPPEKPTITGPTSGKVGVPLDFNVVTTDPEGHDVYYMILWGDGSYVDYTGPYVSGEEATFSHTWTSAGEFNIVVKAQDYFGAKSPQNNLELSITKNKAVTNSVLLQFLENLMSHFPLLEQILQNIV